MPRVTASRRIERSERKPLQPLLHPFAPSWLRCAACGCGIVLLPIALAGIWRGNTMLYYTIPILAWVHLSAVNTLITGVPSKAFMSFVADVFSGRISIHHDDRALDAYSSPDHEEPNEQDPPKTRRRRRHREESDPSRRA